jgi:hypothetical protein
LNLVSDVPDPKPEPTVELPTTADSEPNPRREAVRKDITRRLRRSCSDLSEEAFAALVDRILGVQIKGETKSH